MLRILTFDDASAVNTPRGYYAAERLSERLSRTPEGFLLCEGVPAARIGDMKYAPNELGMKAGPGGFVLVTRDESSVFDPKFLASLKGKPFIDDHPEIGPDGLRPDINPSNWRPITVGVVMEPRRGMAMESDLLLVDILVWDANAIAKIINQGMREVSIGYQADYDETGLGTATQYNLIGNHIALVEAGRCGARCAIGDSAAKIIITGDDMKNVRTADKSRWSFKDAMSRLKAAIKTGDEAAISEVEEEIKEKTADGESNGSGGMEAVHIHLPSGDELPQAGEDLQGRTMDEETSNRFGALEAGQKQIMDAIMKMSGGKTMDEIMGASSEQEAAASAGSTAGKGGTGGDAEAESAEKALEEQLEQESAAPAGTVDSATFRKTRDSAYLGTTFHMIISGSEILVPGIQVKTFDAKAPAKQTLDAMCGMRRNALDVFNRTQDGFNILTELNGGKPLDMGKLDCNSERHLFRSAVMMRKTRNADSIKLGTTWKIPGKEATAGHKGAWTIAEINKRNAEHHGRKN